MMTEENGGAEASADHDAYEHLAPLEMGAGELPVEQPPEAPQAQAAPEAQPEGQPVAEQPGAVKEQPESDLDRKAAGLLREALEQRDKRQAIERENEGLRRQLQEFQRQQQALQQQQQRPDFWEQPESSIEHQIQQRLAPLEQRLEQQLEVNSRKFAEMQFGPEKVDAAIKDIFSRRDAGDPSWQFDYQRVRATPNPYESLVQLHQQRQALAEIGTDPAAYRQKALDEALKDPAFLARALEAARGQAQSNPSVVTYAAPKSRGVPSISNVGGAASIGNGALPDLGDQDLYDKYAT